MSKAMERRVFTLEGLQIEQRGEGEVPSIRGHAAVFGSDSEDYGRDGVQIIERIAHGAFSKTLQEADVRALINHNPDLILGRNRAKTLSLAEDEQGLAVEIDPPSTQYARDLVTSMARGDMNQMSFAFSMVKDRWEKAKDDTTGVTTYTRTLLEVKLYDVSVVTFPAYPTTDASVRSMLALEDVPEEVRNALEPSREEHSGVNDSSDAEPVQADHSTGERERRLQLIRYTL